MSIFKQESFGVECDRCKQIFEHPISGFSLWADTGAPFEYAQEYSWIEHEGKHYCPSCYEYGLNDEVIIKPEAQSAKDVRLQHYIDSIKAGGRPILIGVELSTELYEELLAYVKDEGYRKILKSRVSKK